MAIYTRTGDDGKTSLAGGFRVDKDHIRIETMGEIDEVNAYIGLLRCKLSDQHDWQIPLRNIQRDFMKFMGILARPKIENQMPKGHIYYNDKDFEQWIDELEEKMGSSKYFLLPGGTEISSVCHILRAKTRKAERLLVHLAKESKFPSEILIYFNRLSDVFFTLARSNLFETNTNEEKWKLFKTKDED